MLSILSVSGLKVQNIFIVVDHKWGLSSYQCTMMNCMQKEH
jgi:hypothetical protein